jgi:outer membrane protein, multidrug efflux system
MSGRARRVAILASATALCIGGCAVGPNYHRPVTDVPAAFRFDANPTTNSFGDQGWWQIYQDPTLLALINAALAGNFDVRIAAARVDQAQASLGATRMQQLPQASLTAGAQRQRTSQYLLVPGEPAIINAFLLQGNLSYEVDFWGKYRRMTEAARAQLLSSQYARADVTAGLVSSVATAYFTLQALDEQLAITRRTVQTRQKFVDLTSAQHERGTVSGLDVASAQAQLAIAQGTIPDLERQIAQTEDQLSVLLGRNPDGVLRNTEGELKRMAQGTLPPVPPAGLPSSLLERRPDIREAEQNLVAANAQIGVARANLYPDIDLTASGGVESIALSNLFNMAAHAWTFGGSITQPLLNPQRSLYQVDLADAQKREALLQYELSLKTAFQEVSDALIARQKYGEFQIAQQAQVDAQRKADEIALARYRVGYASYFDVIDADRDLFTAELSLSAAHLNTLLSLVQLYRALGGGWQTPPPTAAINAQPELPGQPLPGQPPAQPSPGQPPGQPLPGQPTPAQQPPGQPPP